MTAEAASGEALRVDALVVGGGAQGLFLLDALVARGVDALLVESAAFGSGQTSASQGILHAGTKYSLGGMVGDDAEEAAKAAELWESMLAGEGCDLRGVRVLARECHLWRSRGLVGAVSLAAAKVALRTRPTTLATRDRPAWLAGVSGEVLALPERVIDPRSLLEVLSARHCGRTALAQVAAISPSADGVEVTFASGALPRVHAQRIFLAAGAGNEALACLAGLSAPMQRRPLRQAMLRGRKLPLAFGHCIDGARTRATITSDTLDGDGVWHIGGQIAEDGVAMSERDFHLHALSELCDALGGFDLSGCRIASYLVDRAEPQTAGGRRPARAAPINSGALTVVWPIKLVLAPLIAQEIAASAVRGEGRTTRWPASAAVPRLAPRPWECASGSSPRSWEAIP